MPVTLDVLLSPNDASCVSLSLRTIAPHRAECLALTGGLAVELHMAAAGRESSPRQLNDIDFIADSFEALPRTLGSALLFRHVHPNDPPGKLFLQAVDSKTNLRIDFFRAYGFEMKRSVPVEIGGLKLRMVSLEDMIARHARLNWDLIEGRRTPAKFARDFQRMVELIPSVDIQDIWQEHRKPEMPEDFQLAASLISHAIEMHGDLLSEPGHSQDLSAICARCKALEDYPLADPKQILSILGYC